MDGRDIALKYAWQWVNTPYHYGGDDFSGIDCSGFVIEVLKGVGKLPEHFDAKAVDLYVWFGRKKVDFPSKGCLVFYGKNARGIEHVELCIDGNFSIGASGGGRKVKSEKAAIAFNAFVKVRPIEKLNKNIVGYVDPFSKEG